VVTKVQFTVDDYYRMAEAGILTRDDRVELIEGEIVRMPPIGEPHQSRTDRQAKAFISRLGDRAIVRVQGPIRLDEFSEPQPDLALLRPRPDFYESAHPRPEDVLLVVEISVTTLAYDRGTKLPLYARHGIPEVWVVDVQARRIEAYREPEGDHYRVMLTLGLGDTISPAAFPDLQFAVSDLT